MTSFYSPSPFSSVSSALVFMLVLPPFQRTPNYSSDDVYCFSLLLRHKAITQVIRLPLLRH